MTQNPGVVQQDNPRVVYFFKYSMPRSSDDAHIREAELSTPLTKKNEPSTGTEVRVHAHSLTLERELRFRNTVIDEIES